MIPAGRSYEDFFLKDDNFTDIRVSHHKHKSKRPLCLRYLATGKCRADCEASHARRSSVSDIVKAALDEKFIRIYNQK